MELPAGGIEEGENIKKAALRELKKETGFHAKKTKILGKFHTTTGVSDQTAYAILATDLVKKERQLDQFEEITSLKFFSVDKIKKLIAKNVIKDGPTIIAFSMYLFQNEL